MSTPARSSRTAAGSPRAGAPTASEGAARAGTAARKAASKTRAFATSAEASRLAVRDDESPWTPQELSAVRTELNADVQRLIGEIDHAEQDIAGLMSDAGDGSGDDQADVGAKTLEREQEISLANNSREMLEQSRHALERIADGTYGICESCGNPIGKLRLQAFPRATLCVSCKQRQERR